MDATAGGHPLSDDKDQCLTMLNEAEGCYRMLLKASSSSRSCMLKLQKHDLRKIKAVLGDFNTIRRKVTTLSLAAVNVQHQQAKLPVAKVSSTGVDILAAAVQFHQLKESHEQAVESLSSMSQQVGDLKMEHCRQLKSLNDEHVRQMNQAAGRVKSLEKQVKELIDHKTNLEQAISDGFMTIKLQLDEIHQLRCAYNELHGYFEAFLALGSNHAENKEEKDKDARGQLLLKNAIETMTKQLNDVMAECASLQKQVKQSKKEAEALKEEQRRVEQELLHALNSIRQKKERIAELEKEVKILKEENQASRSCNTSMSRHASSSKKCTRA